MRDDTYEDKKCLDLTVLLYSVCGVQGRCWPNRCPKQNCIVVPPLSNIMEVKSKVKKKKTFRETGSKKTFNKI